MYKVYADDILIHDSYSPNNEVHLISPKLNIADNSAGSFEMTLSSENPGYGNIDRFTTTIIIKKDNHTIWTGRVISEIEDFWKRKKYTCEGALSYLNDSMQERVYYDNYTLYRFLTAVIDIHNQKSRSNRQFRVGTISVTDTKESFEYKSDYKTTFETINDNLLNRLHGHVRVRYENDNVPILDYLGDYPNTSSQEINFGSNLLDFTKNWDLSSLVTVILPRGKQLEEENSRGDKEYVYIDSVNNNSKYLQNNEATALFGRVERIVDFNEAEDPAALKRLAEIYLRSIQFDDMVLDVSAIDLHMLNPDIVSFNLLDQVRCVSKPHGLDKMFPISEIEIPLDTPENVKYTMGATQKSSITSRAASVLPTLKNVIDISGGNLLANAKHQATEIINQKTTGYVNIITEDETSQALIISNTPDLETATKLWRWNLNGLGYLNKEDNPNGDYSLAITNNGVIVADFIKVGMLEDGYGLNHWNLSTGEFTLAYNTEFANLQGNSITIVDVVDLAQTGIDAAEAAQSSADTAQSSADAAQDTAIEALDKQPGGTNILRGTNKNLKLLEKNSSWENGTWDGNSGAAAKKIVKDISNAPNPSIVKGFRMRLTATSNTKNDTCVQQCNIPVASGQVYTMSCYFRGDAYGVELGYWYPERPAGTSKDGGSAVDSAVSTNWKRYSLTFKIPNNKTKIDLIFGIRVKVGTGSKWGEICGMKFERGNTPTDWSESEEDTKNISYSASASYTDSTAESLAEFTVAYTDVISKNDREFTENQRKALDESFTQYKVLERLTNNFKAKGIYLQNNELYMNASYIRTGTLDAGIVKTGILTDHAGVNKWNMTTGYLYTYNMEAENMRASGRFECGTDYKIVVQDGRFDGYQGTKWVGSISPTSTIKNVSNGQLYTGLELRGKGSIDIRTPHLSIRNKNDNGVSTLCHTGNFKFNCVSQIRAGGNGSISWTTTTHNIKIINGMIVAIA